LNLALIILVTIIVVIYFVINEKKNKDNIKNEKVMSLYVEVLKKYAEFGGRARRKEYWYFCLFNLIIYYILTFIAPYIGIPILSNMYSFAVLIPGIAVGVRRMHDVDKSGWYLLFPIYNLVLLCTEGDTGKNDYGDDPKEENEHGANYENTEPEFKPNEINSEDKVEEDNEPENTNDRFMPRQNSNDVKEQTIGNEVANKTFVPKKRPIRKNPKDSANPSFSSNEE